MSDDSEQIRGRHVDHESRALRLFQGGKILRQRDLLRNGVPAVTLTRLVARKTLERVDRGTYRLAEAPHEERQSFAEVAVRVPNGIVCLISAAEFHGLTVHNPPEVWVGLPRGARHPSIAYPPVRIVYWRNEAALKDGVEELTVAGVKVKITSPARTVVDLFRFRNRSVGREIALEAIRAYAESGLPEGELHALARALGAERAMAPYFEAMASMGPRP